MPGKKVTIPSKAENLVRKVKFKHQAERILSLNRKTLKALEQKKRLNENKGEKLSDGELKKLRVLRVYTSALYKQLQRGKTNLQSTPRLDKQLEEKGKKARETGAKIVITSKAERVLTQKDVELAMRDVLKENPQTPKALLPGVIAKKLESQNIKASIKDVERFL